MFTMVTSLMWRIDYHRLWGQLSTSCNNAAEVAQWATPCCSRHQSAADNNVRDGRCNLVVTPTHFRALHISSYTV